MLSTRAGRYGWNQIRFCKMFIRLKSLLSLGAVWILKRRSVNLQMTRVLEDWTKCLETKDEHLWCSLLTQNVVNWSTTWKMPLSSTNCNKIMTRLMRPGHNHTTSNYAVVCTDDTKSYHVLLYLHMTLFIATENRKLLEIRRKYRYIVSISIYRILSYRPLQYWKFRYIENVDIWIFTRTWLRYVRVFAIAIPSVVCRLSVCRLSVCL